MEPPSEFEYQYHQHRRQQHHPSSVYSQQRGRNSSRNPTESRDTSGGGGGGSSSSRASQSKSNTPRRKGNPQSSSPIVERQQQEKNILTPSLSQEMKQSSSSCNSSIAVPAGPLTPLSTLSSIITTHSAHSHTALLLFRQAHALHRHASERTFLAMEKLRAAQAEVEHATTAQEFAKEELDKAAVQKNEAHDAMVAMSKRVRALSKGLKNERVRLVGLTQNIHWNGRLGTILKLITDGEDAGRWKVKLDLEWRGRDADGKIVHRSDETISDGSDEHQPGTTADTVVAKAENLELIDEGEIDLFHFHQQQQALSMSSRSRSASSKRGGSQSAEEQINSRVMYNSPDRRSRDPLISRRHDPSAAAAAAAAAAVVTPEHTRSPRKQIVPADYVKSEDGRYRESLPHHNSDSQRRQQSIQPSINKSQKPSTNHSSRKPNNNPQPSGNARRNPQRSAGTDPVTKYFSPIRRSPSNDSTRLSSAFSQMLLSPVSFTPVSFHPESSGSFERWVRQDEGDDNRDNTSKQIQQHGGQQQQQQQKQQQQQQKQQQSGHKQVIQPNNSISGSDSFWCAGSYFDEITSLDKDAFPYNEGKNTGKYYEWDDTASDPKLQQLPSTDDMYSPPTANDDDHGHGLPHIAVLPAPEDEYDDAFAPESSPPYCVGVQNAGYSHVNGVYLLAHPKGDDVGNNEEGGTKTAPLYFKDGPPTLLSDNRYYDMCILRINCPDSPDHVIWFLARVDIDPDCLDVKFSDCYYYCRMLRNDDGCGGEREGGCDSPPSSGWHLPKLPPGVDMLSIAKSGSFSTMETASNDGEGGYGLGISSRPATLSYTHQAQHEDERRTIQQTSSRFVSPSSNSATGSKYSI